MNLATSETDTRQTVRPHRDQLSQCSSDGALNYLFFSDNDLEIDKSKAICNTCDMQESCLDGAIDRAEPFGVWGGQLMRNGIPVARRPRRGRPPKTTVPLDIAPLAASGHPCKSQSSNTSGRFPPARSVGIRVGVKPSVQHGSKSQRIG